MGSSDRRHRSRSRDRDRDRRRSRSRDRHRRSRSRTRSRSRDRNATAPAPSVDAYQQQLQAVQAMAAIQQQQQLQRQLLTQQLLLQSSGGAAGQAAMQANRKQREVYVGNLAIGVVTADMLKELFNAVLSQMVQDPVSNPPVVDAKLDASGRFGFIETRTSELADAAMQLDKLELCGRPMNVGRPKGYVEQGANPLAKLGILQLPGMAGMPGVPGLMPGLGGVSAAGMGGLLPGPPMGAPPLQPQLLPQPPLAPSLLGGLPGGLGATTVVLLENLMPVGQIRVDSEKQELQDDVTGEAAKCGPVTGVTIPRPPASLPDSTPCRVYVRFASAVDAAKCRAMMDGRMFDVNKVRATFVTESDYNRAAIGEWIAPAPPAGSNGVPGGPPPLLPAMPGSAAAFAGLHASIPGLAGLPGMLPPPPPR